MLLAGGGLANGLLAWRLRSALPDLDIQLFEAGPALGGNHTWSFHATDLPPDLRASMEPLVEYRWPHSEVRFPGRVRRLPGTYCSLTAAHLHRVVAPVLGAGAHFNAPVSRLAPDRIFLADGRECSGDVVIDGRGPGEFTGMDLRWQKFLGLDVALAGPHGLPGPILMDATVAQADGYRFVYLLPFGPDRLLVEDTYYSDHPGLDPAALRQNLRDYLASRGWAVAEVLREETGVLPIVLGGDPARFWPAGDEIPRAGLRAGLFHPTTGYSLPAAVALADDLVALFRRSRPGSPALARHIRARFIGQWRRQGFFRLLNRLLFQAADPAERWRVLRHFYRLPGPVVDRFYRGDPTRLDRLRILSGRPPVPLGRALGVMLGVTPDTRRGAQQP